MLAASLNGALGHAGLMLALAAATFGRDGHGLRHRAATTPARCAWPRATPGCASPAPCSAFADDAAGPDHPRLLAGVRPAGGLGDDAAALQLHRDVVGARGLDPAVGADPRRATRRPSAAASAAHRRPARRLGAGRDVRRDGVLRPAVASGRPNPFADGAPGVTDGPGPNPLLQNHILVLFHPPILYLGYVGFTVPFAFAIAALVTGRVGEGWLLETRRWALFAWGFLTIGILLGGWWSYEVLGWSGVWAWDPVENASFLPWLTATAYIHSVLVQERRGHAARVEPQPARRHVRADDPRHVPHPLRAASTACTRSATAPSAPTCWRSSALVVVVSLVLIAWRGDRLRSPGAIDSPISREGAFLANNVLFAVFAFVVLLGTVFPLLVEALQDRQIRVGAPYFDRLSMPIGLALLFLMAVAPVLPWRKASTELLARPAVLAGVVRGRWRSCVAVARRRRRAGRRCVAFGLAGFAAGVGAAPARAGHAPPGLARAGRAGQRRHDRAPRRDRHRRRAGGIEQLHPLGDAHPRGRRARRRAAATRSNSSTSRRASTTDASGS